MDILSFHLTLHNYTKYMDVNNLLDIYQMRSKDKCHYCFKEGFVKHLLEITRAHQYRVDSLMNITHLLEVTQLYNWLIPKCSSYIKHLLDIAQTYNRLMPTFEKYIKHLLDITKVSIKYK